MLKTINFIDKTQLYITDDPNTLRSLLIKGLYAIPSYTDDNMLFDWPHTDYAVTNLDELLEVNAQSDVLTEGIDFIPQYLKDVHLRLLNKPLTILTTARTIVREMTTDDVEAFYEIYSKPGITDYIEPLFENIEDEKLYTRNYIEDIYKFYGYGLWSVIDKKSGKIIGRAGVSPHDGFDDPELGFLIDADYQHRGIAYEVCSSILLYSKKELGLNKVFALVHPDNIISIKLLRKLGFEITHRFHQDYLVALRTLS